MSVLVMVVVSCRSVMSVMSVMPVMFVRAPCAMFVLIPDKSDRRAIVLAPK